MLNKIVENVRKNKPASVVIILFTVVYLVYELLAYRKFLFPVLDLGLYNRHFWGLCRLSLEENPLKGFNLIGDHAHFILFLFAPLYCLWQDPRLLLIIQTLFITSSGYPVYLIAKKYFKDPLLSSLVLISYFSYFGFSSALAYPFHVAPLAVLPLSWALYFLLEKKYLKLVIALIFLLIIKEDMPLVIIMLGLYITIIQRRYRIGGAIILLSSIYFLAVTRMLASLNPFSYYYADSGALGATWKEVAVNSVKQPALLLKSFFLPAEKSKVMIQMLGSFALLPILAPEIMILLLPLWAGRFLSTQPWRWASFEHYSANQAPILITAAILAIYRLSIFLRPRIKPRIFIMASLLVISFASISINTSMKSNNLVRLIKPDFYRLTAPEASAYRAIDMIPSDASVGAQSAFAMLTGRDKVYNLDQALINQAEYLLLAPKMERWPMESEEAVRQYAVKAREQGYEAAFEENGVLLLRLKR